MSFNVVDRNYDFYSTLESAGAYEVGVQESVNWQMNECLNLDSKLTWRQ